MAQQNIHFIGFGNMAKAMIKGLDKNKDLKLSASAPSLSDNLVESELSTYQSNSQGVKTAHTVVLCVKPQHMGRVLDEIKPYFNGLLISIAAGIDTTLLQQHTNPNQALIRVMPNTPASIGQSASVLFANKSCSNVQKMQAESLFNAIGITNWIDDENLMHAITALYGSGPAYFYLLQEALINAAIAAGIPEDVAARLTSQTALGASLLAKEENVHDLIKKVTSKNGTTQAALESLNKNHFNSIIGQAINQAAKRSQQLSEHKEY
jgi:pyrroline-5-carboxylate reductase